MCLIVSENVKLFIKNWRIFLGHSYLHLLGVFFVYFTLYIIIHLIPVPCVSQLFQPCRLFACELSVFDGSFERWEIVRTP